MRYWCSTPECSHYLEEMDTPMCPACKKPTLKIEATTGNDTGAQRGPQPKAAEPGGGQPEQQPRGRSSSGSPRKPEPPSRSVAEGVDTQTDPKEVETLIAEGKEIYLVAGIEDSGKTEMLGASPRISFLARGGRRDGRALPTESAGEKRYSYDLPGRSVIFVDASGEKYRTLYPAERTKGSEAIGLELLRSVTENISGLVLALDLAKLWDGGDGAADQEQILRWILRLFRFLYFGGVPGKTNFEEHVENTVASFPRKNRLPFPVHLTFTKADILLQRAAAPPRGHPDWPDPRTRSPLMFAHRTFPELMRELRLHVRNFRVDFAQAVGEDPETGKVSHEDREKLGVDATLDWLVNNRGSRLAVSTDAWLKLQEFWDDTLFRRKRWGRQPLITRGER